MTRPSVADEIIGSFIPKAADPIARVPSAGEYVTPISPSPDAGSYRDKLMQRAIPQPPKWQAPQTVTQHVENLIKARMVVDSKSKDIAGKRSWDIKTANQHRSIARMLVKLAETDDPSRMDQRVLGAYRILLDDLPKAWGKSPDDRELSIDDLRARAQDLEDHEVGLQGTTIDRHMTQLSNIVEHIASNGVRIGTIGKEMRTGGLNHPRGVFELEELTKLFKSPVWTGCVSAADRLVPGEVIIRDALYWVPILARYELLRLGEITGLLVEDVDFNTPSLLIRDNAERRLKSGSAKRRQPLVPEILRLGFLDYAKQMRDEGHVLLFPCLRKRGQKTPLSNLFYKEFRKVLIDVLPNAGAERKSLHSMRKDANGLMSNANVNDPIRHAVMGHAHSGVNEKHYLDQIFDAPKLMALAHIPNATSHLS